MTRTRGVSVTFCALAMLAPAALVAQQGAALDPAALLKAPTDSWPTYHGDYSGRHYSPLTQINADNVKNLQLAWVYRLNTSQALAQIGGEGPDVPPAAANGCGPPTIKATPLMVNGILYFSTPDNAFAVDARTGHEMWHYFWKTRGGVHIGNRGVGMYGNWFFFETPDNYLVSLDAMTGKERWHKEIADVKHEYFSTPAPIIVGNHVLIGGRRFAGCAGLPRVTRSGNRPDAVEMVHDAEAWRARFGNLAHETR